MKPWKTLKSEVVYESAPWIKVCRESVELPDGRIVEDYHQVRFHDYAAIVAENDKGEFLFLKQYRHGLKTESLLVAGGVIDSGEDPLVTAKRELLEEAGYEAADWKFLGAYTTSPSYGCGKGYFYLAKKARPVKRPDPGDLEEMETVFLKREEVRKALYDHRIQAVGVVTAVTLALLE